MGLRVGLTGGLGSGKSTVGRLLAEHGAVVIDSDTLAREVVAPGTPGLAAVVEAFGPEVLAASGELDRAVLAERVFGDEAVRRRLEAIVHPLVRRRAAEVEAMAPPDAVVVHDIPLLVETGQQDAFDVVVVVDLPPELQVERVVAAGRLSAESARARIASQASREERLAAADVVLDNAGTPECLVEQVADLWRRLIHGQISR